MLNFASFLNIYVIMMIFGAACLLAYANLQDHNFFLVFPTDAGDFTYLAGGQESGKAGEIVSRRETPAQCERVGSPELD